MSDVDIARGASPQDWNRVLAALVSCARGDEALQASLLRVLDDLREQIRHTTPDASETETAEPASLGAAKIVSVLDAAASPAISGPRVISYEPPPRPTPEPRIVRLGVVVKRANLKSEAARWAITRRERMEQSADFETSIKPTDVSLAQRARELESCNLWMLNPYQALPDDDALEQIAGCYETAALAAEMARDLMEIEDLPHEELFMLIAEAQSALRKVLADADAPPDDDQLDLFSWLRDQTLEHSIFIHRHMKLDDPADPSRWMDTQERLEAFRSRVQDTQKRAAKRKSILNTIRYEIKQLKSDDPDRAPHHWSRVSESIEQWEQMPLPLSNADLLELLVQVADDLPDDIELTPAAQRAFAAVDRFLSDRESRSQMPEPVARSITPEVAEARGLVAGKVILLIGGEQRLHAKRNLERDLQLAELRWAPTSSHQSLASLEAEITREDVDLVMLAIRWSSHSFGELKNVCDQYGKPFVRLPAGYGVNQVARQLLAQTSEQLI